MNHVLWRALDGSSFERCTLESIPGGHRLSGTTLLALDGDAFEIRYSVLTNPRYAATTVGAHVQSSGNDRRMALSADGEGSWSVGEDPLLELYGAIDPDLRWTPATNSLPILRLGLEVGASAEITAAVVDFPGHDILRRTQRYTRIAPTTYRYESDTMEADIEMGPGGLVRRYGDLWEAVAPATESGD